MDKKKLTGSQNIATDPWTACAAKSQYLWNKNMMDIQRQACLQGQRMAYDEWHEQMRIFYAECKKLIGSSIYQDATGELIYSIQDKDERTIVAKRLLNISGFASTILVSFHPDPEAVLRISWDAPRAGSFDIPFDKEGIATGAFLKKLRMKGVRLLVSGRTERRAAEDFVAYAFTIAETQEIPYSRGWYKYSDGSWHFCGNDEICMREVLKNA